MVHHIPASEPEGTLATTHWWISSPRSRLGWKPASQHWSEAKDGDFVAQRLFLGHYSNRPGRRIGQLILGPGEKMVLIEAEGRALFGWRKFIDDSGQSGVCCAVFRNLSPLRSSDLIAEAGEVAWRRWPGARLYTYVDPRRVKSANPGCCFKMAGWRVCGRTKGGSPENERRFSPSFPPNLLPHCCHSP